MGKSVTEALAGQHVLVVGGSSGIGLAAASAALAAGARVTIAARDPSRLAAAGASLGSGAATFAIDATSRPALDALAAALNRVDHLVLSVATGGGAGIFATLDLQGLRQVIEGKLLAYLETLQALLPALRRDGSVTMVTAASARAAVPGTVGLAVGNGALNAAVPTLAVELAPLRVNAVCPGIVATPIFMRWPDPLRESFFARARAAPVGRVGQPEDVARAILFLIADSFVTGAVLDCDGGIRHVPPGRPAQ